MGWAIFIGEGSGSLAATEMQHVAWVWCRTAGVNEGYRGRAGRVSTWPASGPPLSPAHHFCKSA